MTPLPITIPTIKVSAITSPNTKPIPENNGETPVTTHTLLPKAYGKIVLTNDVLLTEEKLYPTPSSLDRLEEESETELRIMGCELIATAGVLLKLPQVKDF